MIDDMIKPTRQMKREADRAFKRLAVKGCHLCGKGPAPGLLEALLRGPTGTLRAVHARCVRTGDSVLAVGSTVATCSPHIEDDRKWFEANPSRVARLRRPAEGEAQLLVNHAHLAELKQTGQSSYSDRQRELLRLADPSCVAILVLRKAPGFRLRVITFLDRNFDEVTVADIEADGSDVLAADNTEKPSEANYLQNLFDIQLVEMSTFAAKASGKPSIADVARAVGESRRATKH